MIRGSTVIDVKEKRSGRSINIVMLIIISYAPIFSSRDSVLRSGGCVRIRNTRKRSHREVHHTQLRRGIRVG